MNMQRGTTPSTGKLHKQRGMRYFEPKKFSDWTWVGSGLGIVLVMTGAISSGPLLFTSGIALLVICLFPRFYVWLVRPDDKQYDAWVKVHRAILYDRGLDTLGLNRRKIVNTLCIHSVILPGSRMARQYPDKEVRTKQGKDEQWRFSVNVYTYFFFTRHYVGIFQADINVFHPSKLNEQNDLYDYQHIVSIIASLSPDEVIVNKQSFE